MMTASRALNNSTRVAAGTRERVLRVAAEVGYRPSLSARALRNNQSRLIGLVAPNLMLPLHIELILGARDRATELDHELLLQAEGVHGNDRQLQNCDGNLVIGPLPKDHAYDPRRTVNLMGQSRTLDVCRTDGHQATYEGFRHLLQIGYRRIGLIVLAPTAKNIGRDRALEEFGIPLDSRLTKFFGPDNIGIERGVGEMLDLDEPPDALVVHNVSGTPLVLRELQRRGVRIGRDIAFIGTEAGRSDWGDLLTPRMTSIRIPAWSIGVAGAERLIARLQGDDSPPKMIEFPARLVVRESTPVKAG
jgi:DNA-binding LacI/PurR family transcriptional regulator